jgi:signal transduction histidine kinase
LYVENDFLPSRLDESGDRELAGEQTRWRQKTGGTIRVRLTGHLTEEQHRGRPILEVIVEDVTEDYRLQEHLRRTQRMEALGQLAGSVAHDFNNLLTAILGYTGLIIDQIGPDKPIAADLQQIKAAGDRAADLTRQLLAFSRKQVLAVTPLNLTHVVRALEPMLCRLLGTPIRINTDLCDDLRLVMADPAQFEHLLINLAVNARDAMGQSGVLRIATRNVELDATYALAHPGAKAGAHAALSVADEGVGMSPDVQDKIFEPFFTTKERGQGTGLGLAAVYGAVKQLGGYIDVESQPGLGSTFTIYLPATADAVPIQQSAVSPLSSVGHETILLVDDEPGVRAFANEVLRRSGYHVIAVDSAEAALTFLEKAEEPIQLLVTDLVLPGMNGHELAVRVARDWPRVRVLLMSGYAAQLGSLGDLLEPGVLLLEKPFSGQTLLTRTRELLATRAASGDASPS